MLVIFDFYIMRRDFAGLYNRVRHVPLQRNGQPNLLKDVLAAVDEASIWYWKEVRCLQRSAATACLLKRNGVRAQMVIGAQQIPFKAHAWVEIDACVVGDKPYMSEKYVVLDRC